MDKELELCHAEERYITLTDIGKHYGVSGRAAGRWLVRLGLRGTDLEPSKQAKEGGYCKQVYDRDRNISFWVWHGKRTLQFLENPVNGGQVPVDEVDEGDWIDRQ